MYKITYTKFDQTGGVNELKPYKGFDNNDIAIPREQPQGKIIKYSETYYYTSRGGIILNTVITNLYEIILKFTKFTSVFNLDNRYFKKYKKWKHY